MKNIWDDIELLEAKHSAAIEGCARDRAHVLQYKDYRNNLKIKELNDRKSFEDISTTIKIHEGIAVKSFKDFMEGRGIKDSEKNRLKDFIEKRSEELFKEMRKITYFHATRADDCIL